MRWNANQKRSGPGLKAKENDVPIEQSHELGREASKHAVGRLVIQFRERASRRVAWFAIITFVVALILVMPGGRRLTDKLMPADWWTVKRVI
jgi:hypothetical protein